MENEERGAAVRHLQAPTPTLVSDGYPRVPPLQQAQSEGTRNGVHIPKLDFSFSRRTPAQPHEGSAFLERATALVRLAQGRVAEDHLTEALKPQLAKDGVSDQSTTVGITFEEMRINHEGSVVVDGVMFGGPAYRSKNVSKGDIVLGVDGMQLYTASAILAALKGNDIPGTSVTLTMKNPDTNVVKDVIVQRQLTAEVAEKRKMFDLFTGMQLTAKRNSDADTLKDVEQALAMWIAMLVAEEEKDARCVAKVESMQGDCGAWLAELLKVLDKLDKKWNEAEENRSIIQNHVAALPEPTPPQKSMVLVEGMQLAELVEFCENMCKQLQKSSSSVFSSLNKVCESGANHPKTPRSKTTIGIMLCGLTIEQMVWGGPAHNSGQLEPGDQILKVDGKDVTEDTFPSVVMAVDTPGSIVTLTVLKSSGQKRDVTLRRMSRDSIDDQVTMFELFTNVKEVAAGQTDVVAGVDACMQQWSEMLRAFQDNEASMVAITRHLQEKNTLDLDMCLEGLKRMMEFSKDRRLLNELYDSVSNGVNVRINEVRELNEEFMRTRERIVDKARIFVRRERNFVRDAVEKAVREAKLEAQALQKEMEKTQYELKAERAVLTQQLQQCTSELKNETKMVQGLQTDVIVKANQIISLQEQIDDLKHRMKAEVASKQAEIEDKKKHISELLASLVQHQELQNNLSSNLKITANELGRSQQQLWKVEEELSQTRTVLEDFLDLKSALQQALKDSNELEVDLQSVKMEMESAKLSVMQMCKAHYAKLVLSERNASFNGLQKVEKLNSEVERLRKAAMQKIVFGIKYRGLAMALKTWQDHTIGRNKMNSKALKVVQRLMNGVMVSAFEGWRDHIIEEQQMKNKALKVAQRLKNGALVSAFEGWRDHIIEEKQVQSKALKVVRRLKNGALVSAFEGWRDHIIEEKQMRAKARKVVQRLMNATLVHAFEGWRDQTSAKADNPTLQCVSLTMPMDFDSITGSEELRQNFDEFLESQICAALSIDPEMVQVLCHERGSVKTEVVLSDELCHERGSVKAQVVLSDELMGDGFQGRDARTLARDLEKVCTDPEGVFATCGLKLPASSVEMQGFISKAVANTVQASITEQRLQKTALKAEIEKLQAEAERVKAELEASNGEVQVVKKEHAKAQRACEATQKMIEDKDAAHAKHRNCILDKFAARLLRKTVADEFLLWRELAQADVCDRKMAWLEEQLEEKVQELKEESERLAQLEKQCAALRQAADEAEAKLDDTIKKMCKESATKQADIVRLKSEVDRALNEKEAIKHDFNVMQEHYCAEITRSKTVGKSPRTPRTQSMMEYDEDLEKARLSAEQNYVTNPKFDSVTDSKGKYFMC